MKQITISDAAYETVMKMWDKSGHDIKNRYPNLLYIDNIPENYEFAERVIETVYSDDQDIIIDLKELLKKEATRHTTITMMDTYIIEYLVSLVKKAEDITE